jgi:ATP-dependent DNA helicase RecG
MTLADIQNLIAAGESLTVEFKGEERTPLSDREIYEAVVCLANTDGGVLLIGVEDDRRMTGARPRHGKSTDPSRLQAAVFNNTEPRINTRVSVVPTPSGIVIAIEVDRYPEVCATRSGLCVRRVISTQGPECIPFYPHEHTGRRAGLGLLDFSAQLCPGASWSDLDPLQFERLRQTVTSLRGDASLTSLSDRQLAQALQLVETKDGVLVPNVAGALLLGREDFLRERIPTHEAAFQVLAPGADVRVNNFFHKPLLETIEEIQKRFDARVEEKETLVGMIRLPIPDYSRIAFREALLNALLHRDFSQLGTVYIQWHPDHLLITDPGGFIEGVTPENILVHEPKPRNPRLYAATKRIGLVEQTGRGVDKIYLGQLRYGRPAPDYSRSDRTGVRVVLHGGKPSLEFAAFIFDQESKGQSLALDEVLVLNALFHDRRINSETAASLIQKPAAEARSVLEALTERGWLEAKGEKKGRVYHFSAMVYRQLKVPEAYVRAHGIDPLRQEGMVIEYLHAHAQVKNEKIQSLLSVTRNQANHILTTLRDKNRIKQVGTRGRHVYYVLNEPET